MEESTEYLQVYRKVDTTKRILVCQNKDYPISVKFIPLRKLCELDFVKSIDEIMNRLIEKRYNIVACDISVQKEVDLWELIKNIKRKKHARDIFLFSSISCYKEKELKDILDVGSKVRFYDDLPCMVEECIKTLEGIQ